MTNFKSLVFYIILFSISTYLIFLSSKTDKKVRKKVFVSIGLAIPILMSALRYNVGTDFNTYVDMYNAIKNSNVNIVEGLFSVICKIAIELGNVQYMFAIYSILTIIFIYKALEYNKDRYSLSLCFFLYLFFYFVTSFNLVRQALAVAIVFYSYRYLTEKNLKKFVFWVLIASLAHKTALVFLPLYFIVPKNKEKISKTQLIQVISIMIIMMIVLNFDTLLQYITNFSMFEKYTIYTNAVKTENKSLILKLFLLGIFLCFRKQLKAYEGKNNIYIVLFVIGVLLEFTGFFSAFVKRIAIYFTISDIYLITCLPKIFNKKDRNIILLAIICYTIVFFTISFYIKEQSNVIPYRTIYEEVKL